jgi:hypothetical protein
MKRESKPRPKQPGIQIQVRVQPEQVACLDAWIENHPEPKPSRPEAIREAISEHLKAKGYLK